jgi:hypothetical protein
MENDMDKLDQLLKAVEKVAQRVKFLEYKVNLLMDNVKVLDGEGTTLEKWQTYKDRQVDNVTSR